MPSRQESANDIASRFPWNFGGIRPLAPNEHTGSLENNRGQGIASGCLTSASPWPLQTKLEIGAIDDPLEREADHVAAQIMRVPEPASAATPTMSPGSANLASPGATLPRSSAKLQRKCSCGGSCEQCKASQSEEERPLLQRQTSTAATARNAAPGNAPPVVDDVLRSPGEPLDANTRQFMEGRLGQDFSSVRIHRDGQADEASASLGARAFTVGDHVAFRHGDYSPASPSGRSLLAHELTHVVQQRGGGVHRIQRFAASETDKIAPTYPDMLTQVRKLIDDATTPGLIWDDLNMSYLVEIAGGASANRAIGAKLHSNQPTIPSRLFKRYIFTCRCGLIDMRHFFQLLYISNFASGFAGVDGNRAATKKGREHELEAESESRFGAEDTPSNALGALTNVGLAANPGPDSVYDAIKDTLDRCAPIDWSTLAKTSQDKIVKFYSETVPDPSPRTAADKVIPKNQEQTAVPAILDVPECSGHERSLPFRVDPDDPDRKTFAGRDFLAGAGGLKSGKDVKRFVDTQRPEIIRDLPLSEKIRLLNILLDPPVEDDDLEAARVIYKNSTGAELVAEPPNG